MHNNKKSGSTKTNKQINANKKKSPVKNTKKTENRETSGFAAQLTPYLLIIIAIFTAICMFAGDGAGIIGGAIRKFLLGISGGAAFALPVFIIFPVFRFSADRESGILARKNISSTVIYFSLSVLLHIFGGGDHTFSIALHWSNGIERHGGGVIGGILGEAMLRGFGKPGTLVIMFALISILTLFIFGITPRGLWILIRYKMKIAGEDAAARRSERYTENLKKTEEREQYLRNAVDNHVPVSLYDAQEKPQRGKKKKFSPDVPIDEDDFQNESDKQAENTDNNALQSDFEDENAIDERIFDEVMRRTKERREREESASESNAAETVRDEENIVNEGQSKEDPLSESIEPLSEAASPEIPEDSAEIDLKKIFVNPEDAELLDRLAEAYMTDKPITNENAPQNVRQTLEITRNELSQGSITPSADEYDSQSEAKPEENEQSEIREYLFPPISLLTEDTENRNVNIKAELHDNAVKLVETLRSFNVKTKIENVSRGPTITRYELLPEPGIRVRSILNLSDDIALNLATTGIRIEAPIPGKAAVGIEVPNKKRAVVHLRTLLEDDKFTNSSSKLMCALGEDVGGEPVYLDIEKMPHLLIAGATGMGKSVCINSLITSILFGAKPDEVKLILIDPKKVELNIYNGIPHLLVPVVSDPKKAAGSLSWAVSEMERRFGLIEAVGVRDIRMYNKITENDPEYEFLPYIVIIIDELADLMMTAPDDVEESVCRLMQKARAAGMHVIIGTQRPSVDVITGLIKANIPSRIAFTVASQVDSRTIIDRSGAENLIGRGDMLYIPVGAAKPIRVQGAFVSENDVEKIVTFIKSESSDSEPKYADDVIEQIEREAAKCGNSKKGAASISDAGNDDPMLRPALELAVNSGKISTSLIQRRLQLGYGRAAKLIDKMEQLGYVSAPDGQKPRSVLITKEQFMEMVLKNDENLTSEEEQ